MTEKTNLNKKELSYKEELILKDGDLMDKQEVARFLKVHVTTIDRYMKAGKLTVKKIGNSKQAKCYFVKAEVLTLLGIKQW